MTIDIITFPKLATLWSSSDFKEKWGVKKETLIISK